MKARFTPVALENVDFNDSFFAPRININRESTLPKEYEQLRITGRLTSFNLKTNDVHCFWDSDTAKWVEAAAYSLAKHPDPKLAKQVDDFVDLMAAAQMPDGYLNSYYQTKEIQNRWKNLRDMHELYQAGHLMEAAVALKEHCGKTKMLDVLCKFADHIKSVFGVEEGKKRGYCGHPEIELALVKLYRATGKKDYLDLATYFVNQRGQQPHYFDEEAKLRGENRKGWYGEHDYGQAHKPLREQESAEGHSVRACYLYAGMADVANETGDAGLIKASRRIWDSIATKRMYVTGGVGSSNHGERFTVDYDLPDDIAYAEACASIALVFFAHRMLNMELDRKYADVMEQALYNCIFASVSLDGGKFFYANRLAVYPKLMERKITGQSFTSFRQDWFGCACCPPNIARLMASLGEYTASTSGDTLAVHLYAAGEIKACLESGAVKLSVETEYPWDGKVNVKVAPEKAGKFTLCLRLPSWCAKPSLTVNGKKQALAKIVKNGYAHINREWKDGDVVELNLPMEIERLEAHPSVRQMCGQIALRRGPIVYCIEECDNGEDLADITLPRDAKLTAKREKSFPGGCVTITGKALRRKRAGWDGQLYRSKPSSHETVTVKAVPYCLWDNRKEGEMRVWIREA